MFVGIIPCMRYTYELILCKPNREELTFVEYSDLSYNPLFLDINKMSVTINRTLADETGIEYINPVWELIKSDYLVYLKRKIGDAVIDSEYMVIEEPVLSCDGVDTTTVQCYSYQKIFLCNRNLDGFKDRPMRLYDRADTIVDGWYKGVLNYILNHKFNGCWKIGHMDAELLTVERVLNFSGSSMQSVFDTLAESFNCAFVFDNVNMVINVYMRTVGMLGKNRGLVISSDDYAVNIKYDEDTVGIKTRLTVYGKNQASIARYNPTGQLYVDDFSYYMNQQYMSSDLIDALTKYNELVQSKTGVFTTLVERLDNGDSSVQIDIDDLRLEISWESNFTIEQIMELTPFIKESTIPINTISDSRQLYEYAVRYLKTISFIPIQISIGAAGALSIDEYQLDWSRLTQVGDFANIYRKEFNLIYKEMRLVGYTHNPVSNTLSLDFSNIDELVTNRWQNERFFQSLSETQDSYYYDSLALPEFDFDLPEIKQEINNIVGDSIVEVVENKVIVSETAMLMNVWARNLTVERFETNFDALDLRLPPPENYERLYEKIYNQSYEYRYAKLSPTETENYLNPDGEQIYYTAVGEHPQAYKYFTIADPVELCPADKMPKIKDGTASGDDGLTREEFEKWCEEYRETFRVKVRKTLEDIPRLTISFNEKDGAKFPTMKWGTGDETGNGIGYVYKNIDGMYFTYTLRAAVGVLNAGDEVGDRITDSGVREFRDPEDGEWKPVGSGGTLPEFLEEKSLDKRIETALSNLPSHIIIDHLPTQAEIDKFPLGALVLVKDKDNPFVPTT